MQSRHHEHSTYKSSDHFPVICEREVSLMVGIIRQAFEDANQIGGFKTLTGEGRTCDARQGKTCALEKRQEVIDKLRGWMSGSGLDHSERFYSLNYLLDRIAVLTKVDIDADAIRHAIEEAIAGRAAAHLTRWRALNVVAPGRMTEGAAKVRASAAT